MKIEYFFIICGLIIISLLILLYARFKFKQEFKTLSDDIKKKYFDISKVISKRIRFIGLPIYIFPIINLKYEWFSILYTTIFCQTIFIFFMMFQFFLFTKKFKNAFEKTFIKAYVFQVLFAILTMTFVLLMIISTFFL